MATTTRHRDERTVRGYCQRCGRRWVAPDAAALAQVQAAHTRGAPGQRSECERLRYAPVGIRPSAALRCDHCGRILPVDMHLCDGCGMRF